MKKKIVTMLTLFLCLCCFGACGKDKKQSEVSNNTNENAAILVVSFGTSYNDSRDLTIGGIETAISTAFPEYQVRRAFTSQIIIDKLKERDGIEIDNVKEALDRAVADGIKELVVQPTHLMDGYEYQDFVAELSNYVENFDQIIIGEPLLMSDEDFTEVVKIITGKTASYDDGQTAICFMGHGTGAESNAVYAKLQDVLSQSGYENYYIGTVEATPSLEDMMALLSQKGFYQKVVLEPLMVVAGDHANNDMAGDEADSWKSILESDGYEVECILEGLGQIPAIQDLYVKHLQTAINNKNIFTGSEQSNDQSVITSEDTSESKEQQNRIVPMEDGIYQVEVESDSSMFRVTKAELTVSGGSMTAVITLSGTGYSKLYMGTVEQAVNAADTEYIPFVEAEDGTYTYAIPVVALDQPIECAAFSKKKEEWYDRNLTFHSNTIESDVSLNTLSTEKTEAKPEDGTYAMDIIFAGGSGKAEIISPVTVTVAGDKMIAKVEWNSANYDYMMVDGEKYLPINTEGNSVFEIPVSEFDREMTVIGDTVAMSKAHEVEYTITFLSNTIKAL